MYLLVFLLLLNTSISKFEDFFFLEGGYLEKKIYLLVLAIDINSLNDVVLFSRDIFLSK